MNKNKEYIEREAVIEKCNKLLNNADSCPNQHILGGVKLVRDLILIDETTRVPAADVEPVRHAYWEEVQGGVFRCSDCHCCAIVDIFDRFVLTKCCHNCGAKMDKEE